MAFVHSVRLPSARTTTLDRKEFGMEPLAVQCAARNDAQIARLSSIRPAVMACSPLQRLDRLASLAPEIPDADLPATLALLEAGIYSVPRHQPSRMSRRNRRQRACREKIRQVRIPVTRR